MTRVERAVLRFMAPPAVQPADVARNDLVAVSIALAFLAVLVFLCSVIPGSSDFWPTHEGLPVVIADPETGAQVVLCPDGHVIAVDEIDEVLRGIPVRCDGPIEAAR